MERKTLEINNRLSETRYSVWYKCFERELEEKSQEEEEEEVNTCNDARRYASFGRHAMHTLCHVMTASGAYPCYGNVLRLRSQEKETEQCNRR